MAVAASSADASPYFYWPDNTGVAPPPQDGFRYQRRLVRHRAPKVKARINESLKEANKPVGPLIIAISIEQQSLKVYDANGFFAQTPVSTGMRGHPTPMGAFSIIQKHKLHHSNIYSNAPMPYMQRITWSGVAMHAGVLPGYPASHGCIRMPMNFALKMWGWTRMGARVIVTPGEVTPSGFSHPLLITQKPMVPVASAAPQVDSPSVAKADKAATATAAVSPAMADLELKPSVGADIAKPVADEAATPSAPRDRTRTADAAASISGGAAMVSDAPFEAETNNAEPSRTVEGPAALGKPEDKVNAAADTTTLPQPTKDQTRAGETMRPAAPMADSMAPATPKRSGQIAVFISRKDSKLYVRQNFSPLFETPITIAPSDRPLGTHIFTAQTDKADANRLHWSVVSLPSRNVQRYVDDDRASRRRNVTGAVEVKPAVASDTPAEALDRLTIPQDAMARIADALSTGGSIIVSDQGITAGETGEGTDFIVSLR